MCCSCQPKLDHFGHPRRRHSEACHIGCHADVVSGGRRWCDMLSSVQKEVATQPQINPVWWWTLIKHLAANDSQSSQAPMSAGYIREKPEELLSGVLTLTFGIRRHYESSAVTSSIIPSILQWAQVSGRWSPSTGNNCGDISLLLNANSSSL